MTPTPAVSAKEKARERIEAVIRMCGNARDNLRDGNVSAEGTLTAVTGGLESIKFVAGQALAALSTEGEAEPVAVANCCQCGRIIDTREKADGGGDFGCETTDGRWTCSPECWEIATGDVHPPSAPAGVKVKPLEWEQPDGPNGTAWLGHGTDWCQYYIRLDNDGTYLMPGDRPSSDDDDSAEEYKTLDEAKAAAQADYESRIRSSLQPDTQAEALPAGVKALMNAVRRAEDGAGTLPARESVKLRPADWAKVCRLARSLSAPVQEG